MQASMKTMRSVLRYVRPMRAGFPVLIVAVFGGATVLAQVGPAPVTTLAALPTPAPRVDTDVAAPPADVHLVVGRSTLIEVGAPIARVSLTSADIADALVTAPSQLLVHGKVPGAISMFVWSRAGTVQRYEIAVQRDLVRLSDQITQLFPNEPIEIRSNGRSVILSGTVSNKDVADRAVNVAASFTERREDVVTLLQVRDTRTSNQVLLRVRFAEVNRSALTEFGMSFFTSPTGVRNTLGRVTTQQYAAPSFTDLEWSKQGFDFGAPVQTAKGKFAFSDFLNFFLFSEKYDLGTMIRAMQQRGLFESLAEPNLVAQSGKEASFLAGGEFPVPVMQGAGQNVGVSVQFKEFGIRLHFTPTVNGDRVQLKVRPEVSTLDYGNAVVLQGFRIPALQTRRTETELELRDGQTFAIAGLLNNELSSTLQKVPGIGDIPILGHLFRSRAAQKQQTELVVIITPEILSTESEGVTNTLPRLQEPFMAPLREDQTTAPPAPAFRPTRMTMRAEQPEVPSDAPAERAAAGPVVDAKAEAAEAKRLEAEQRQLEKMGREQAKKDAEAAERQAKADAKMEREAAKAAAKAEKDAAKAAAKAEKDAKRREAAERKAAEQAAREQADAGQAVELSADAVARALDEAAARGNGAQ